MTQSTHKKELAMMAFASMAMSQVYGAFGDGFSTLEPVYTKHEPPRSGTPEQIVDRERKAELKRAMRAAKRIKNAGI